MTEEKPEPQQPQEELSPESQERRSILRQKIAELEPELRLKMAVKAKLGMSEKDFKRSGRG